MHNAARGIIKGAPSMLVAISFSLRFEFSLSKIDRCGKSFEVE
jgi:hypothetical protein